VRKLGKHTKSTFEYVEIAKKVVIKQLTTDAVNKCYGDQIFGIPPSNSGGVATSMLIGNSGEVSIPFLPLFHLEFTL
jgi:hypothetical protein